MYDGGVQCAAVVYGIWNRSCTHTLLVHSASSSSLSSACVDHPTPVSLRCKPAVCLHSLAAISLTISLSLFWLSPSRSGSIDFLAQTNVAPGEHINIHAPYTQGQVHFTHRNNRIYEWQPDGTCFFMIRQVRRYADRKMPSNIRAVRRIILYTIAYYGIEQ